MNFEWNDAWVLLAIIYAGKQQGAALENIIAAADYINHSIIAYDELNDVLGHLVAHGFVILEKEYFIPSDHSWTWYQKHSSPRRSVANELIDMLRFLNEHSQKMLSLSNRNPQTRKNVWIAKEQYRKAVKQYLTPLK